MRSRLLRLLPLLLLPAVATGCIIAAGGKRTEYDEASRYYVSFETAQASDDFHAGLQRASCDPFTDGGVFFILGLAVGGGAVFHETQFYNAQVRLADIDRNSVITEAEARRYANRMAASHHE